MKKALFLSLIALMACGSTLSAQNKAERKLPSNVRELEITKGANVSLVQGNDRSIEVITEGCPTADVITEPKEGKLTVKMKKRTPGSAVQVILYFNDLDKITVKRGGSVETDCLFKHSGKLTLDIHAQSEAKLDIEVDELEVSANTCNVKIEGKATTQKVNIAGTVGESSYDASELKSENVEVKAVDSDVTVCFTESLKAEAVNCKILYDGDDSKVTKTEKMGGSVEHK